MRRKPKTQNYRDAISRLRGILRKPGGNSLPKDWAEHKREELALEDRKTRRRSGS